MSNFFQGGGVQVLISIEYTLKRVSLGSKDCTKELKLKPIYVLVIFQGECPDPLSPSGSAHGQSHHNGTIFITVRPLTIIVRH